jgi:hypothetical protein
LRNTRGFLFCFVLFLFAVLGVLSKGFMVTKLPLHCLSYTIFALFILEIGFSLVCDLPMLPYSH